MFVSTATCICVITLENAEPPASASMPTDVRPVAKPRICASVRPIWAPAPARRDAIFIMADSVVAKLFPKSTNAEPKLRTLSCPVPVMLKNWAMVLAASFATMSVDSPKSIIVLE